MAKSVYLTPVVRLILFAMLISTPFLSAEEISTNEVVFTNPPTWLNRIYIERIVDKIQATMEWDIRKVRVQWFSDQDAFQKFHGFDSSVLAVSKKQDNSIALGPRVTNQNFDTVFGHELVHTIIFQKYKDAIPAWLNEGLANYVARRPGQVDYSWLKAQPAIDVRTLVHPFQAPLGLSKSPPSSSSTQAPTGEALHMKKGLRYAGTSPQERKVGGKSAITLDTTNPTNPSEINPRYHYQASTALVEMVAAQCSLDDLLQLSVGKKLENYLETYCNISDINASFQAWLKKKAG